MRRFADFHVGCLLLVLSCAAARDVGATSTIAHASTLAGSPASAEERRWIKHKIISGEMLGEIAERYGVTPEELIRWNKLSSKSPRIYAGRTLKVHARKFPPPRKKITYKVRSGDTWVKIAERHKVEVRDLLQWNKRRKKSKGKGNPRLLVGDRLVVWTNPVAPEPSGEPDRIADDPVSDAALAEDDVQLASALDVPAVRPGAVSVGRPNRGRIRNSVQLPESDLYTIRDEDKVWGASHALSQFVAAIATFRRKTGYVGEIVIGAISRRGGGRFRPHKSHQSGRDVDLRLPKKPGVDVRDEDPDGIDWRASWELIKAFSETGEVEYIFLEYRRQARLFHAAKALGASAAELAKLIQYPRGPRKNHGLVRHAAGHVLHVHIRFKCAPKATACHSY